MLRSDAKPLKFMDLEAFTESGPGSAEDAEMMEVTGSIRTEQQAAPPIENCPHCEMKISPLERKFGQCMSCNRPVNTRREADSQDLPRPRLSIRI